MIYKQIIGSRGSAKSYTLLNTIEVMLENEKLNEALKAKQRECEQLKEKLRTKARGWANVNDQILKELAKIKENYKQTIIEIKEIAEKKCLGCTNFCNDDNIKFCVIKQILQKISEVEDGKNP